MTKGCKDCSVFHEFSNLYCIDGKWCEEDIIKLLGKLRSHSTIKGEGTFIGAIIDLIEAKNSMINILKNRCDLIVHMLKVLNCNHD